MIEICRTSNNLIHYSKDGEKQPVCGLKPRNPKLAGPWYIVVDEVPDDPAAFKWVKRTKHHAYCLKCITITVTEKESDA